MTDVLISIPINLALGAVVSILSITVLLLGFVIGFRICRTAISSIKMTEIEIERERNRRAEEQTL